MIDWDDLRVFIAAARAGSLSGASQKLGIDPATVGRRLTRLETALKCTLVARSPTGLVLTAAGANLLEVALNVEASVASASEVSRADMVAGTVRISASEGFGTTVLAPALPGLTTARPALRIELIASSGFLSPSRREADMAITLSPSSDPRLAAEPLTTYQLALYTTPEYLARKGEPRTREDLHRFDIVGYVNDLVYAPELRYIDEISTNLKATISSTSIQAQLAIVRAGGGVGVLPCFLAQGLTAILPQDILIERRFWLSTSKDVHDSARMRAVARWLRNLVNEERQRLSPFARTST